MGKEVTAPASTEEVVVAAPQDTAAVEQPAPTVANGEAGPSNQAEEVAETLLTSRPRRSLRNSGRPAQETIIKKTVKVILKNRPQRKWDAERLLTDPKSPLAKANLRSILSNPLAWSSLEPEDREQILALFPDQRHIRAGEDGAPQPNMESLMNDDSFRYDCAAYTESLAQGRHDPDWLAQAWAAHERRKAGDFDEFLRSKFENDWDVKIPSEPSIVTARSALGVDGEASGTKTEEAANGQM